MIVQLIAFVGGLLTMITTVPTICIGRFLYGVTAGHANIIMSKSLDETVPKEVFHLFGILTNAIINVGLMFTWFLGALLPTEEEDYKDDNMWRIIFLMPCLIAVVQIVLFLTVFKQEPIGFCIANDREDEAKVLMKRIYWHPDGVVEDDFDQLI